MSKKTKNANSKKKVWGTHRSLRAIVTSDRDRNSTEIDRITSTIARTENGGGGVADEINCKRGEWG